MYKITTLFLCLLTGITLQAQSTGNITGKIYDAENQPAMYANIILQSPSDSSMIKGAIANENGEFSIARTPYGNYQIMVNYVGFDNHYTAPFELNSTDYQLPDITLKALGNDLSEVTVTAQRPMLEMKPDKLVFNVDGTINSSGGTGLELLRKSPGVMIDNNDNINLLGKSGVRVYIDGKESPLSGDDLSTFLKTLQADQIDAIEIITNPSAKYDAEGNAGIINIKLKRDQRHGSNANLNLGYSIGEVAQYNGSISANHRNKKLNVFGSYGYNYGDNLNYMNLYREQGGFVLDTRTDMNNNWQGHNYKIGSDYFVNDKNTIGFLVNGYVNDWTFGSDSRTPISMLNSTVIDSVLVASSAEEGNRDNNNFNVNYQFDNDKETTLNVDLDYGIYRNANENLQPNFYKDAAEVEVLNEQTYANIYPTDIDIYTFKTDFERPVFKGKVGAGIKSAYVKTDNTFEFFNVINEERILDDGLSNRFVYKENVNAAYLNYSRQLEKIGINAGLRTEQTNWTGDLTTYTNTGGQSDGDNYIDFFPSAGISYQMNQKNSFNLSYSRRINRPSYQDLNPFESRLDELTFEKGNVNLRPEYTNNFQIRHAFNYSLNTTLSYSRTNNVITRLVDVDDNNPNASFITWENIAKQDHYSINVAAPVPIKDWWSTYTSLTLFHMHNQADFGDAKIIDVRATTFQGYMQHTIKFPKDFSFEVSGWFLSPSIWGGNMKTNSMGSMDIGVQKKIMDGKGKIKVSLSDVFKTNAWSGVSRFGDLYMDASGGWDSRRLRLNFSYLFGNDKVKSRKRKTGLEDESNRIKTD